MPAARGPNLGGTNTYLGSTTVVAGATLQAHSTSALSPWSTFFVNGTLSLAGNSNSIGSVAGTGTVSGNSSGGNTVLTVGADNTSTTFSGTVQDSGSPLGLAKVGA